MSGKNSFSQQFDTLPTYYNTLDITDHFEWLKLRVKLTIGDLKQYLGKQRFLFHNC